MAESKDSRAEILIVAGAAAILFLWWVRNQGAGAGTGLTTQLLPAAPGDTSTNAGVPLSLTMPDQIAGVVPTYGSAPSINIGGATYSLASPSACGCGAGGSGNTYGGADDLAASLLAGGYDMPFVQPGEAY